MALFPKQPISNQFREGLGQDILDATASDPLFEGVRQGEGSQPGYDPRARLNQLLTPEGQAVAGDASYDASARLDELLGSIEPPPVIEEERGTLENLGRGMLQRGATLTGGIAQFAAEAGERLDEAFFLGGWGTDGTWYGPSQYEEYKTASKGATGEDFLTGMSTSLRDQDFDYIPGTTWEDVKTSYANDEDSAGDTLLTALSFAIEQGLVSLPDMAMVATNLPVYMQARTGEIARNRAENAGREEISNEDLGYGATAAVFVSLAERIGVDAILGRLGTQVGRAIPSKAGPVGRVARRGATGATAEATTEAAQEAIEYTAETVGQGFTPEQMFDRMLAGWVGGAGFGGPAGVVVSTGQEVARPFREPAPTETPSPNVPPATTAALEEETESETIAAEPTGEVSVTPVVSTAAKPAVPVTPVETEATVEEEIEESAAPAIAEEPVPAEETPVEEEVSIVDQVRDFQKREGAQAISAVRNQAIKPFMTAMRARYPDVEFPSDKGTIGVPKIAQLLTTVDEQVGEDFPNLREGVREAFAKGGSEQVIAAFNKMQSIVESEQEYEAEPGEALTSQAAKTLANAESNFEKSTARKPNRTYVLEPMARVRQQLNAISDAATVVLETYKDAEKLTWLEAMPAEPDLDRMRELQKYAELSASVKLTSKGFGTPTWPVNIKTLPKTFADTLKLAKSAVSALGAIERKGGPQVSPKPVPTKVVSKKRKAKKRAKQKQAKKTPEKKAAPEKKARKPKEKKEAVRRGELEVQPKVLKGRGMTSFLERAGLEVPTGTTAQQVREEILPQFNQQEMRLVQGLEAALTSGQKAQLHSHVRFLRNAKTTDQKTEAQLRLKAFLSDIDGQSVPENVQNAVVMFAGQQLEAQQRREAAEEQVPTPERTAEEEAELAELMQEQQMETELGSYVGLEEELSQLEGRAVNMDELDPDSPEFAGTAYSEGYYRELEEVTQTPTEGQLRIRNMVDNWRDATLGEPARTTLNDVLDTMQQSFSRRSPFQPLIKQLRDLNLRTRLTFNSPLVTSGVRNYAGTYRFSDDSIHINDPEILSDEQVVVTILHEAIHAGTVAGLNLPQNQQARSELEGFFTDMKLQAAELGLEDQYGFRNLDEFVAEGLSNPTFQNTLKDIEVLSEGGESTTALQRFFNFVRRLLGLPPQATGAVARIADLSSPFFLTGDQQAQLPRIGLTLNKVIEGEATPELIDDTLAPTNKAKNETRKRAKQVKDVTSAANLGFMANDQIERNYRELFRIGAEATLSDDANLTNPLSDYINAKNKAENYADRLERSTYKVARRVSNLTSEDRTALYESMRDSTMAGIHADESLRSRNNAHLWRRTKKKKDGTRTRYMTKVNKKKGLKVRRQYEALSPEAKQAYTEMKNLTRRVFNERRSLALELLGKKFDLEADALKDLRQITSKGAVKEFMSKGYVDSSAGESFTRAANKIVSLSHIKGPYFPLRRYGEHVVSNVSKEDESYVSFHKTEEEAIQEAAKLNAEGRNVHVTRKVESAAAPADMASVAADLTGKVSDPATKDRLNAALVEAFAENAAYASQLRRMNIEGVKASEMGQGFQEYMQVSKYVLGDLATSYEIEEAIKNLKLIQSSVAFGDGYGNTEFSQRQQSQAGLVVNELLLRNKEDAAHRNLSPFQRVTGALGFFNFLGAPSYWALNATQTYAVTLPYLSGQFGSSKQGAFRSLKAAQGTVLRAAQRASKSEAGLDRDTFLDQLPAEARALADQLISDNVIQSTLAHEFGTMLRPQTWTSDFAGRKYAQKFMSLLQEVPEGIEYFNRLSTALAAHRLSGGDYQAAVDAVNATQFNYATVNRARLLKSLPQWIGGGGKSVVSPIMMFKTFGVGLARLLYGNMARAATGKTSGGVKLTRQQRRAAAKTSIGIMFSHALFGGFAAGLALEPFRWAYSAMQAFIDEEDEETIDDIIREFVEDISDNEFVQNAMLRGIPGALGVDMSQSISLGNLFFMGRDDIDLAERGGVQQAAFQLLGPVAQYAGQAITEFSRLVDGTGSPSKFAQSLIPLKAARGVIKAYRQREGMETYTGLEYMPPEEINFMDQLLTGAGFRATSIARRQEEFYGAKRRERAWTNRRTKLLRAYYKARTPEERQEVAEDIRRFNSKIPDRRLRITGATIFQSRQQYRKQQRRYRRGQFTQYDID